MKKISNILNNEKRKILKIIENTVPGNYDNMLISSL